MCVRLMTASAWGHVVRCVSLLLSCSYAAEGYVREQGCLPTTRLHGLCVFRSVILVLCCTALLVLLAGSWLSYVEFLSYVDFLSNAVRNGGNGQCQFGAQTHNVGPRTGGNIKHNNFS